MARARNIKASIMDNEDLAEIDPLTRLLFIYLWMLADREGRLEDRPKRIAAQALAYDRMADVDAMLTDLQGLGFIVRYMADGVACIQIVSFAKHQSPHVRESASTLPRQGQETTKAKPRLVLGDAEALPRSPDCGTLNPDCGTLNPDCGTLIVESKEIPFAAPAAQDAPVRKKSKVAKETSPSADTWAAYSTAYEARYGVEPVRNATVNGQLAQLVSRLGADESPMVAAWYVGHQNQFYVGAGHSVGVLLRDAEKLRTQWATNRATTQTQALQADKTAANFNAFAPMLAEAKAKERGEIYAEH